MPNKKRKPDLRKISPMVTYSVGELASTLDRGESTIRQWIEDGLEPIDDRGPTLLHGSVVKLFLKNWWDSRKHPCAPHEIYCTTCQKPQSVEVATVRLEVNKQQQRVIIGECVACGNQIRRITGDDDVTNFVNACTSALDETVRRSDPSIYSNTREKMMGNNASKKFAEESLQFNANNERIKREYYGYRKEAEGLDEISLKKTRKALYRLEQYLGFRDLNALSKKDALRIKERIRGAKLEQGAKRAMIADIRKFFQWLRKQPGNKTKIDEVAIEYLQLSRKEVEASKNRPPKAHAELAEVISVIRDMPETNEVEFRDKAMLALLAQTAVRAGALITLRLKHIDLNDMIVHQPGDEVNTKNGKNIYSPFLSIDKEFDDIVPRYIRHLRNELGFGDDDPLFPKLLAQPKQFQRFRQNKLSKNAWTTPQQLRVILNRVFNGRLDVPVRPHDFRHMLVAELQRRDLSLEEASAWSQALGHESLAFTFKVYGRMSPQKIAEVTRDSRSREARQSNQIEKGDRRSIREKLRELLDEVGDVDDD